MTTELACNQDVSLKNCPFCGNQMNRWQWVYGESDSPDNALETVGVCCINCECHGPMIDSSDGALSAWNNRT